LLYGSIDELYGYLIAECSLRPLDLIDISWDEVFSIINAKTKAEERKTIQELERTRYIVWACLRPSSKSNFKPKDALKFPWDKSEIKPRSTKELKEILKAAEIKAQLKNG